MFKSHTGIIQQQELKRRNNFHYAQVLNSFVFLLSLSPSKDAIEYWPLAYLIDFVLLFAVERAILILFIYIFLLSSIYQFEMVVIQMFFFQEQECFY